ncbi:MAG: hypothetical protein OQL19_07210 [Gammaproteobacteria bacterium]|nr:hypothetical protein [Gammaproteobacteria bacterium]
MDFLDKLKSLIGFGQITGPADNTTQFPIQQMSFKDKIVNVMQIFPYGLYGNIPSDDALGIIFAIDGNKNNKVALSFTPQKRPVDLEQNEVAFYHPYTGAFIKLRNNGDLEINTQEGVETPGKVILNCANLVVSSEKDIDIAVASGGVVNLDADKINLGKAGNPIARTGDAVSVTVTGGSSAGTYTGTITGGGVNTSL